MNQVSRRDHRDTRMRVQYEGKALTVKDSFPSEWSNKFWDPRDRIAN